MDTTSPAEGPDTFSRVLPLPFRLQFELILGFWLWALNLHGFYNLDIDIFTLIHYPTRPSHDEPPLHVSVYRLATLLTGLWVGAMVIFWNSTHGSSEAVIANGWIPNLLFVIILLILFLPRYRWIRSIFGSSSCHGLHRLLTGLLRCAPGGIAKPKGEKFGDVLLADALTSYSKPISEVFVVFCMFFKGMGTTNKPDRVCGHEFVVPLAIAWPFVIRLRQCLKEGQWANAAKYATAFPVIILSSMQGKDPTWKVFWYVMQAQKGMFLCADNFMQAPSSNGQLALLFLVGRLHGLGSDPPLAASPSFSLRSSAATSIQDSIRLLSGSDLRCHLTFCMVMEVVIGIGVSGRHRRRHLLARNSRAAKALGVGVFQS